MREGGIKEERGKGKGERGSFELQFAHTLLTTTLHSKLPASPLIDDWYHIGKRSGWSVHRY